MLFFCCNVVLFVLLFLLPSESSPCTEDLMVKFVAGECVLEHFRALWTQTVLHVCNAAKVYHPEEYSFTAIGQSLAQRHLLLSRIEPKMHLVTVRELCVKVPFQVYDIEISPRQQQ